MVRKVLVGILIAILAGISLGGNYYLWRKYSEKSNEVEELTERISQLEKDKTQLENQILNQGEGEKQDQYEGWKTYTNTEIGYTLRYPSTWTIEEVNKTSQITGGLVKYIIIKTSDDKYFLMFGLKPKTEIYNLTDRTGVGAGDFQIAGTITILNTQVKIEKLVFGGKVKEYFYPQGIATTADGRYQFLANFSYNSDKVDYEKLDMKDLEEVKLAEKILKSINFTR